MNTEQWAQLVAKAWQDEKFKKRLLAEPVTVLNEYGIQIPAGIQIRIQEDTHEILHLTIPLKPSNQELSDADLDGVVGGLWGGIGIAGANQTLKKFKDAGGQYKDLPQGWGTGQNAAPTDPKSLYPVDQHWPT